MRDIIPKKYLETHDYEDDPNTTIIKNRLFMPDGKIPLDLAVCRWLALEKKVVAMPTSFFYFSESALISDKFIRLGICKGVEHTSKALARMKKI
jgi:aspartate/methionine/tyrosine aminotransferase